MANTSPRPVIGSTTGLLTYVDPAGNLYPAIATADNAAPVGAGSGTTGSVDLLILDPNLTDVVQPSDFANPNAAGSRNVKYIAAVPDQGNAGVSTTPTGSVSSGATSLTVASATGIPATGYVTGPGIAQTTAPIANAAVQEFGQGEGIPTTQPAGTPYTISGTTVTLGAGTTAALTSSTPLFFSAQPSGYWRYPTAYTI